MTILKAEILTHLNGELNRTETNIDQHILAALKNLSLSNEFLWVETTVPTIAGRPYYSLPLDYIKKLSIKISTNNSLRLIDWGEYQALIANETSADYDEPDRFCIHGGFWYPYPTPDAIYTATLFYNAIILESEDGVNAVNNIAHYFGDVFRNAINTLTKAYYCLSIGMKDSASTYLTIFANVDLPPLEKLIQRQVRQVAYNDL